MTVTLVPLAERPATPPAPVAVVTSDGVSLSWHELFTEFAPAIRSFARSRGASSPDDIVQEVFATAVEKFPGFDGDRSGLRSLLFTLAYRRIADDHRARFRRLEDLVADHDVTIDETGDVEEAVTSRESADEAMAALENLDVRERRVIEMRIIEEASPAEVAAALGISNGNVRVIQARALMKIRKHLSATTGATPSVAWVFAFLKAMRERLPDDGGLGRWVAEVRAGAGASLDGSPGLNQPGVPETAAAAATAAASGLASGALKIGLVVSLTTASALGTIAVATADHTPPPSLDGAPLVGTEGDGVGEIPAVTMDTEAVAAAEAPEPDAAVAPVADDLAKTPDPGPDPVATVLTPEEPVQDEPPTQQQSGLVDDLTNDVVDPVLGTVGSLVEETVETLVDDVVNPLVDDVVVPVVEAVVEVVDETVETVVDDVVAPVVDDVVAPVVDEIEDLVDDIVDDVVVPVVERLGKSLLR